MQLSEDDPTAFRRRASMLCLVGAHLLLVLALGTFLRLGEYDGGPSLPLTFFAGLAFAQASLIGIWASLGVGPWWLRLVGLVVGSSCLAVGAGIGIDELEWSTFSIFTSTAVKVAAVLTIFRCFEFRIGLPRTERNDRTEFQFGIRHLLILTVVVSVLLAVGRNLQFSLPDFGLRLLVIVIASACALIGVLSPWAMLRGRFLVARGVILLVISAAVGWGVAQTEGDTLAIWLGIALTVAVLLIASLLVVRLCGYRLMRRRKLRDGQEPTETGEPSHTHHEGQESQ